VADFRQKSGGWIFEDSGTVTPDEHCVSPIANPSHSR
jgi:hypothetical protein